ncbi:hypothetical protein L6452_28692 [Arctium lappa]|uniref:Uncharacterized protein n=1 Tax=Arctium lappa TaxID=4217 RepID=A0ACB8ZZD8_ARCLA|nr:hypothetical protein L6452_28692 [Arctium lappa]
MADRSFGGKSTNKPKNNTADGSPAKKRRYRDRPAKNDNIEDTATSKRKEIGQDVDVEDIEVLEGLLDYRSRKGVFPFEHPTAMKNFLRPWLILHIGNEDGWKTKLEQVKTKFTKASDPIENGERKEFELWKKIWGNKSQ